MTSTVQIYLGKGFDLLMGYAHDLSIDKGKTIGNTKDKDDIIYYLQKNKPKINEKIISKRWSIPPHNNTIGAIKNTIYLHPK